MSAAFSLTDVSDLPTDLVSMHDATASAPTAELSTRDSATNEAVIVYTSDELERRARIMRAYPCGFVELAGNDVVQLRLTPEEYVDEEVPDYVELEGGKREQRGTKLQKVLAPGALVPAVTQFDLRAIETLSIPLQAPSLAELRSDEAQQRIRATLAAWMVHSVPMYVPPLLMLLKFQRMLNPAISVYQSSYEVCGEYEMYIGALQAMKPNDAHDTVGSDIMVRVSQLNRRRVQLMTTMVHKLERIVGSAHANGDDVSLETIDRVLLEHTLSVIHAQEATLLAALGIVCKDNVARDELLACPRLPADDDVPAAHYNAKGQLEYDLFERCSQCQQGSVAIYRKLMHHARYVHSEALPKYDGGANRLWFAAHARAVLCFQSTLPTAPPTAAPKAPKPLSGAQRRAQRKQRAQAASPQSPLTLLQAGDVIKQAQ